MSIITVNTYEAKAQLSKLLAACSAGDQVTIARGNVPVARLVAVAQTPARTGGFLDLRLSESSIEESLAPLDPEALPQWLAAS